MPFRFGHSLLALSLAVSACMPGVRRSSAPLVIAESVIDARKGAVIAAHARLQGALDDLDSAGIAGVIDRNVQLVLVRGDTLRGAAVHRFLTTVAADRSQRLVFAHARLEQCLDGTVLEYDGDFAGPRRVGTETLGRYDILWVVTGDRAAIHTILLGATRASVRGRVPCSPEFRSAALQQRFAASFAALGNPFGLSSAGLGVAAAMRTQRLAFVSRQVNVVGPLADPFPQSQSSHGGVAVSLRARSARDVSGELLLTARLTETTSGYDSLSSRFVQVSSAPVSLAAMGQYQRGSLRLGAGPALLLGRLEVRQEQRTVGFLKRSVGGLGPTTAGGSPNPLFREVLESYFVIDPRAPQSASSLSPAFGLAADAAFMVPLSRKLVAEFHVTGSAFSPATVPSTSGFAGSGVSARYLTLGVALSKGW